MKRFLCFLAVLCLLLAGCGNETPQEVTIIKDEMPTVGICLPGTSAQWEAHADILTGLLWDKGYTAEVVYAEGDARNQLAQMQEFLAQPVACLLVTAVDPLMLTTGLEEAKNAKIPVIAYDRILTYTSAAACCVAPDSYAAGQQLARYILDTVRPDEAEAPLTIEFFMGTPDDTNSVWMYQGILSLLQPYLDKGKLVCLTGRTVFEDVCVVNNDPEAAWNRCHDMLVSTYEGNRPDILCVATDSLAEGCITALEAFGFTPEENWPIITGSGATADGLTRIGEGYQSMTLYLDETALATTCVDAIHTVLTGQKVQTNVHINNGATDVDCLFLPYTVVSSENYTAFLPTPTN